MIFRFLVISIAFLKTYSAAADGFPIDDEGNLLAPYLSLKLEKHQQDGLRFNRTVALTDDQLVIINKPGFPVYLDVLDPFYANNNGNCTCGMIYGIWVTPDSIAILEKFLDDDYRDPEMCQYFATPADVAEDFNTNVLISPNGGLFFQADTIAVTDLVFLPSVKKHRRIFLYLPPQKDNPDWPLVKARIEEIYAVLPKHVKVVIY